MMPLREIKQALRQGPYAWPGGYPRYFLTKDGEALSFEAVRQEWRQIVGDHLTGHDSGWTVVGTEINWEEADLLCCHTGKRIESAYAEDLASRSAVSDA